jgi:hypothetical protein
MELSEYSMRDMYYKRLGHSPKRYIKYPTGHAAVPPADEEYKKLMHERVGLA